MSQPQGAFTFTDFDREAFLTRRLREHGATVWAGATTRAERIERYRDAILTAGLECTIIGRRPDRKPETYAEFFARIFSTPLTPAIPRKGK